MLFGMIVTYFRSLQLLDVSLFHKSALVVRTDVVNVFAHAREPILSGVIDLGQITAVVLRKHVRANVLLEFLHIATVEEHLEGKKKKETKENTCD